MSDNQSIDDVREQKRAAFEDRTESDPGAPDEPIHVGGLSELTDATDAHDVVLVDFYADWCGPCRMIEPVVAEIAAETDAAVAKVDVDRNQHLAAEYGVQGVPTLLLFAGGEPVQRIVGAQSKDALVDLLGEYGVA